MSMTVSERAMASASAQYLLEVAAPSRTGKMSLVRAPSAVASKSARSRRRTSAASAHAATLSIRRTTRCTPCEGVAAPAAPLATASRSIVASSRSGYVR